MKRRGLVTKAAGTKAPFSLSKFRKSLRRAGANAAMIQSIESSLFPPSLSSISSLDIYKHTLGTLKKIAPANAGKYKLKRALMELGPSGYLFEKFVGQLLRKMNYNCRVGVILPGKCVRHEVDVVAENESEYGLVECKFRNRPGFKSDVKVPLYIHARFNDIMRNSRTPARIRKKFVGWVFTNAAFTTDAIAYGNCVNLKMVGWNYPPNGNLQKLIEEYGLYPITCLFSLSQKLKSVLLEEGIITCEDLVEKWQILKEKSYPLPRGALREARTLLKADAIP